MQSANFRSRSALILVAASLSLGGCERGGAPGAASNPPSAAELAELDRGVGLMGQFDFAAARDVFAALASRHPGWYEAQFDLAVATLNRQQEGDEPAAGGEMRALLKQRPDDLRALYVLGLITLHTQSPQDAEPSLRRVVDGDPQDAYARYFLAQAELSQGRTDSALALFDEAIALDPWLRSARYGASQALARLGRTTEATARLEQFQRQRNNPLARLAEFKYTRMGAKAEAVNSVRSEVHSTAPNGALFDEPVLLRAGSHPAPVGRPVISAADIDGDGQVDLFVPGGRGGRSQVLLRRGDRFEARAEHPLSRVSDVEFAAWGDIDNDGLTDVLLCRSGASPVLVRQVSHDRWSALDVPALKPLGEARDCQLFDADNDGSLDLFVVTRAGERVLLSNNGDGTFRPLTDRLPPPARRDDAIQTLVTDLDNGRRLALIVLHSGGLHEVMVQDALWNWRPARGFDQFVREPAVAVVAADLQGRGEPDLLTLTPEFAVRRWTPGSDGSWVATTIIPKSDPPDRARAQLAVADLDGDGRPEIILTSGRAVAVWRVSGETAERLLTLTDETMTAWTLATLDDKGPALIVDHEDGSVTLRRPGPGRFSYALLALSGRDDKAASLRSNASGIGARVAARIAGRWVVQDSLRDFSGPGQNLTPIAFGLGGAPGIDYVSIDWSDGVFQTELALGGVTLHRIAETQRQLSSCPLVFAWNGERYAFVSDILGVGGIGYLLAPGQYAPPRPWENLLLPAAALQPRDGRYQIKIAEPMEEAAYIDSVRLVAHDLPPGWDVVLDERMRVAGPDVTGRPRYFRREALPVKAVNDRGEDVTALVREVDLKAADPGPHDRRFIGRLARDHVLTLEFATDLDAGPGEPLLIADGWIEYPYSQTMFAAWQAGADYRAPTLEAKGSDGRWTTVLEQFGYPAGMPRRMSAPLAHLPRGTRSLRLRTNQEIYWDRLSVAWAEALAAITHALPLAVAEVRPMGFPRQATGPQRQPSYDVGRLAPLWDTRIQSGFYTAFGRIDELVAEADDGLAIIGPGEQIHLEFNAALPRLASGWSRRFVLETHGWAKDMDLYTRDGDSIGPLPVTGKDAARRDRLNHEYNTRFASGR
jgi:tetratricopeptide (TPR) repeat protein